MYEKELPRGWTRISTKKSEERGEEEREGISENYLEVEEIGVGEAVLRVVPPRLHRGTAIDVAAGRMGGDERSDVRQNPSFSLVE